MVFLLHKNFMTLTNWMDLTGPWAGWRILSTRRF